MLFPIIRSPANQLPDTSRRWNPCCPRCGRQRCSAHSPRRSDLKSQPQLRMRRRKWPFTRRTRRQARTGGVFQRLADFVVRRPVGCDRSLGCARARYSTPVPQPGTGDPEPADLAPADPAPRRSSRTRQLNDAFRDSSTDDVLMRCAPQRQGVGPADEQVYRTLVDRLHRDIQDVVMLQDFVDKPGDLSGCASRPRTAVDLVLDAGARSSLLFGCRDALPRFRRHRDKYRTCAATDPN